MIRLSHRNTFILLIIFTAMLSLFPSSWLTTWRLGALSLLLPASANAESSAEGPFLEANRGKPNTESREKDLERQLDELSIVLRQCQSENASLTRRLKDLAEVREYLPTINVKPAWTLQRLGGLPFLANATHGNRILIGLGRENGVAPGHAVLQGQAALGIVTSAGARTAEVQLLTHPDIVIAARLGKERVECYVRGNQLGKPEVVFLGRKPEEGKGAMILTSGLLGIFPPNLLLGELESDPVENRDGSTFIAPLLPRARLDSIEEVLVLKVHTGAENQVRTFTQPQKKE